MNKHVHLYIFKLPRKLKFNADQILNDLQIETFQKITHEKRRREFLASRFVLNEVLGRLYSQDLRKLKKSRNGKPGLKDLYFNLSHSGDYVVLAVSQSHALGVDIETSKAARNFRVIAKKYFSENENLFLEASKRGAKERFEVLWSLKEAYVKALDTPLNKKSIRIYFDVKKQKLESLPSSKTVSVFLNTKMHLSVCVVGKVGKKDLKVYDLLESKSQLKIQRSELRFVKLR